MNAEAQSLKQPAVGSRRPQERAPVRLILGLDPGSRRTGFGLVAVAGDEVRHIEHGVIELRSECALKDRLKRLHAELAALYGRHKVNTTVVEKIFFGKNADSAFKLGHARGVCLLASAQHGADVEEYAARFVKKCITGSGAADKEQVQLVVFNLLRLKPKATIHDASDALSLALTHARVDEINSRLKSAMEASP